MGTVGALERLAVFDLCRALALGGEGVRCCADPHVRGGRCENCGEWIEDMGEAL